eukprot:5562087-Pyramimonas_sp.AAC.1
MRSVQGTPLRCERQWSVFCVDAMECDRPRAVAAMIAVIMSRRSWTARGATALNNAPANTKSLRSRDASHS